MVLQFLEKVIRRIFGHYFLIVPKASVGIIQHRQFQEIDLSEHVLADRKKYLVIEKGKYRIALRECPQLSNGDGSEVIAVIDNAKASFEVFWNDEDIVQRYNGEDRQKFFREALDACRKYIHGRVGDVGCGSGAFLKLIATLDVSATLYGIDFSWSSVMRSRRHASTSAFVVSDIYHLACCHEVFDTVICMETLEHLDRVSEAINELLRICRKGGHVIITIPNGVYDDYVGHLNFWSENDFRAVLGSQEVAHFQYLHERKVMVFVVRKT
jgi:ubiquinone/menaquinone biosynthesis C-methylase UbiE